MDVHDQITALSKRIKSIENLMDRAHFNPETRDAFFNVLDDANKTLKNISVAATVNVFWQTHIADLREKLIELHGTVDTKTIDYEMKQIREKTKLIRKSLDKSNKRGLANRVSELRHHIHTLSADYRVLKKDFKHLHEAQEALIQAETFLLDKAK